MRAPFRYFEGLFWAAVCVLLVPNKLAAGVVVGFLAICGIVAFLIIKSMVLIAKACEPRSRHK